MSEMALSSANSYGSDSRAREDLESSCLQWSNTLPLESLEGPCVPHGPLTLKDTPDELCSRLHPQESTR